MEMESSVPPGFRFHPTEEELVGYYLTRKINSQKIDLNVICDIDLYRMEPWDIQGSCKLGYEEQNEWYFFSFKDRKYPTGTRTNRATGAGFWKATGRDKAVVSKDKIIGMRKTLVFYRGRAPNGRKTDWIMHEYRLQNSENGPPQEEGWVVCRAFKKPSPGHKQRLEMWNNLYHDSNYRPPSYASTPMNTKLDHINQNLNSPSNISVTNGAASNEDLGDERRNYATYQHSADWNNCDKLLASQETMSYAYPQVKLPKLDSPSKNESFEHNSNIAGNKRKYDNDPYGNWKNFDVLLAPQVSDETSSYAYTNMQPLIHDNDELEWFAEL